MSCEVSSTTPMRPPPVPLAPHSSSSSLAPAGQTLGQHNASAEDIGALVGDSFSDVPSDDSGSWMNRVDVSNFAELTAPQPNASAAVPATVLALDHGLYAASAGRQRSSESCRITETGHSAGLQPSPDSSQPEALAVKTEDEGTRDRTSFGSVDQPRDFAAEAAADNAARAAVAQEGVGGFPMGQTMLAPLPALVTATSVRPKPSLSYSCLIALALKNSTDGRLTVAEIYNFMCENFPYFRSAPAGWKNSVRHNLSLNKCFEKIEVEAPGGHGRKSCLWTMNPNKIAKMENEVKKSREKDPSGVVEALATPHPEEMELLERGLKGMPGDAFDFGLRRDGQPPLQAVYQAQAYASPHRPHGPPHQTEMVSVSPAPPGTPPRPQLSSPAHSATAPRHFSTPTQAHRPPSAATAHQAAPHASSPYPQTPPFSPSLHSPRHHLHVGTGHGHWATSTPHVAAMHSPFSSGYGSSVGGAAADFVALSPSRLKPYDTMANALNNNSLLQTALAHSPCRLQLQSSALPLQTL